MFSIDGLVSGFDTTSIIGSLLQFQQNQIDLLNSKKLDITTEKTSFGGMEAQLVSLRASLGRLNRTTASVFDTRVATSSDDSILTAAAGTKANNGVYSLTVNSLAKAHQIASQGFQSDSEVIASGTMTVQLGDRTPTTITIDETNNTVQGFVDAVNENSPDVSASIVHDQSSDTFRILLTSNKTGTSNEITITDELTSGLHPDFTGDPVQAAENASITLGSGPGAITAEYETNQIDELINDVTLNLVSTDPGKTITVSVASDTEAAKEAVENFVDDFNNIMEFIDAQTAFNPETNTASPLLGNRNVTSIQDRLRNFVIDTVVGLDTNFNRLADIGIDITSKGRLSLDNAQLNDALNGDLEGIDSSSIKRLFGLHGDSTNSGIEFTLGSTRTKSSTTPYEVDIIQAAEQASVAGVPVKSLTTIADGQNQLQFSLNGQDSGLLTLTDGTYTPAELADHVESVINSSSELAGQVSVSVDENDQLTITTAQYGSNANIQSLSGDSLVALGFDGSEEGVGKDVAGTFIVDGVTETATGTGRLLVGDADNDNTADLQIRVTLTADQIVSGSEAQISVTRGVSAKIDQYLTDVLDPNTGKLSTINEGFDTRISSIDESIARVIALTNSQREYLVEQFATLETTIANLQQTGNFLSSQLTNISG